MSLQRTGSLTRRREAAKSDTLRPPPSALRPHLSALRSQLSALVFFLLCLLPSPARAQTASEYDLKAAFVFNFVLFTTWPESALPPPGEPFVIGILGTDPFGSSLDRVVAGETVGGHGIVVRRFADAAAASRCGLVYIGRSEENRLPAVLAEFRGKPVLTVSDVERFAYIGGVIGMTLEQGKLRLHINVDRARSSGLTIGAKLLRLSRVISDTPRSMVPTRPWPQFAALKR